MVAAFERFWLGTHETSWLERTDVPLFISNRRLVRRRTLPRARGVWALDSGGFTELAKYGGWTVSPTAYASAVRRYRDEVGNLAWAAPQDWMCEPSMLASTGLTISEHQARTVSNYLELRHLAADLPFVPVLQGWTLDDYRRCWAKYEAEGVALNKEPLVGLGSVCRRQATREIRDLIASLAGQGLRLHGFGVKTSGLRSYAEFLTSSDSMAWSYRARRAGRQQGCQHSSCANCLRFALAWRARLERRLDRVQMSLPWN